MMLSSESKPGSCQALAVESSVSSEVNDLAAVEREFAACILDNVLGLDSDGASGVATGPADGSFASQIVPAGTLSVGAALDVYRNGYVVRLCEQLGETYEALWWCLGDEDFFSLCRRFIGQHRSHSHNLSDYGGEFAALVGGSEYAESWPFLADLARFEWSFKELFHQREHAHAGAAWLASHPRLSDAPLRFGEACLLFRSDFSIHEIWKARHSACASELPDWRGAQWLLAYKLGAAIYIEELDEASFAILSLLRGGSSIDEALSSASESFPDFGENAAAELFARVLKSGIVSGLDL